jgi:hypothetical protein
VEKTGEKTGEKAAEKAGEKTGEKAGEKAGEKGGERSVVTPITFARPSVVAPPKTEQAKQVGYIYI